ncbi:signal peptide peptidase-like 4 isoform X4 [Populus alba x Populus x berolinensis]|uniref:Signal peptide peptidase-like 4 isoform X4 n=1 Tax=Populus alba x Populus x berolinensis TaxID=444605 RepID=A0AAD6LQR9_9ROSI|nr:signal peptide peptidase-like 4 isoform X4 [Populus alba x Populus x berolinensis]
MNICKNICVFIVVLASSFCFGSASDIVHQDDIAPKRPGCENNFVLVKVATYINGVEDNEYVGVGARFGLTLESKEKHANLSTLALADPPDCCSKPRNKLSGEVILAHRGNCSFTAKANVAEDAGASAILIINNQTELFKMVCEVNETDVKIGIAAVMLPQDAGASLEKYLTSSSTVKVQLYSPRRPVVDVAEVFLWLMAVGTILCASYWSAWSAREAAIEQDKLLKDGSDEFIDMDGVRSSGIVNINTASAILFVVIASCFLVMLYKLMSYWFIEVLVVLFCIGGVEVDTTATALSWFIYMLCKNPAVQNTIAQEVREATKVKEITDYAEFAASINEEALEKMHYLHAAISETLRLMGRFAFLNDTLPDGFNVRKGDMVAYQPYAMGRMKFIWGDDAEEYKPERWLQDGVFQQESPFKFTAFQQGHGYVLEGICL